MAKEVQLKQEGTEVFPRTLDSAIAVSGGTTLLSNMLGGIVDGSVTTGYSNASNKASNATYAGIATKAYNADNDKDGNEISTTYLKSADMSRITNAQIDALFT